MLRIEVKTRLTPEDVMQRATKYFHAFKLKTLDQSPGCASFEGGGGGVNITVKAADGITTVELVSREWDSQVKNFTGTLPERVPYN